MTKIITNKALIFLIINAYFAILFRLTIFRSNISGVQIVNFVPFLTINEYIQFLFSGYRIFGFINIAGNIIMFLPFGYIVSMLFPKTRKLIKIIFLSFIFSVFIETTQYIFACGVADIDDVILNTFGGAVGYLSFVILAKFRRRRINVGTQCS
ncbi:MAG: VanZ family protein [Lachnospiraceae bacterium]|nr:VanZ family protein [Lachnospiraceae bacterium]